VRIAVDAGRCTGHGRCYTLAPDFLGFDDDGYVDIRGAALDVPEHQIPNARDAADTCPERAITLTEGGSVVQ
jgi:ferredoxin